MSSARIKRRESGKNAFDLIEETTHLLRTAPVAVLATYYLGTVPFVLGLLYFWTDMSYSPFAYRHAADGALGITVLFLWMKFWQAIFARQLRARVAAEPAVPWTVRRWSRIFLNQAILQPSGLFVIPLALIVMLPLGWVYAFYQNVTVLDDGDPLGTVAFVKKAWKQAALWPRQNHVALTILTGFGFYVFLNWLVVGITVPHLIKMLFGTESIFTRNAGGLLNSTFLAGMFSLTYLCLDPILKGVYVLRCFYGESLASGADLRAELNAFDSGPVRTVAMVWLGLMLSASTSIAGPPALAPTNASAIASSVAPAALDQAISQTVHEDKYAWRMPRGEIAEPDAPKGLLARFLDEVGSRIRQWARAVWNWVEYWLRKLSHRQALGSDGPSSGPGWVASLQILLFVLVAVVVAALAVLLYRVWRGRRMPLVVPSEPLQPMPDIADENVGADRLPGEGWIQLGRELLERGDYRLAMRAFFLAGLAHLAARNFISLARFKSNRDYVRELSRRAHSFPDMLSGFGNHIGAFERVWYGRHEVDRDGVLRFAEGMERMKVAG